MAKVAELKSKEIADVGSRVLSPWQARCTDQATAVRRPVGDMKANQVMFTRFEVNNTTCKIAELERTICELERAGSALETQIENEEAITRVRDPADVAYSTFAKATRERRDRLRATVHRLEAELEGIDGAIQFHSPSNRRLAVVA
jgi:polyhydroxyalkanoate synthesis regulator phasin